MMANRPDHGLAWSDRSSSPAHQSANETPFENSVGGTLIWYYTICPRQAWLMGHAILPDEDDPNLVYGRFLHSRAYQRDKRQSEEITVERSKLDILAQDDETTLVVEIKKSDRYVTSARMQLAHYLLLLEEKGVKAEGELRFPEQRRRIRVILDDQLRDTVRRIRAEVIRLILNPRPPLPKRIRWCRSCAYAELCWS